MSCCGQGRAALRKAAATVLTLEASFPAVDRADRRVLLRYQATTPVTVRGVATGRLYRFDAEHAVQHVAELDAGALLKSRSFVRGD